MSMFAVPGAYDRAITVFSPDGRLFQVEYASETVKRGATVLGILSKEGIVLAAEERAAPECFKTIRRLKKEFSQYFADFLISIHPDNIIGELTRKIGEIKQLYTQHAGVRPFGVSILFAGIDKRGCRLFWTDPSGAFLAYKAWAIGAGGEVANEILEAEYKEDLTLEETILLALKCMAKVLEGKVDAQKIRVAIIPIDTKKFRKLLPEEVEKYVKKL
ncbi:MAG: proteasome subunit alpha [Candidatus Bathyarchaeia archaeon]